MTILTLGATAHFGRQTALSAEMRPAAEVAEVARGDLTEPDTRAPAVEGLDAVFAVSPYKLPSVIADHHCVGRRIAQTAAEYTCLRQRSPSVRDFRTE